MNRKIIVLVVVMLLLSFGTAMAFEFEPVVDQQLEFEPMAYQYLRTGYVSLSNQGNLTFYLYGDTLAKQQVSSIEVTLILQQYKNGAWVNVWSENASRLNASSVSHERLVSVPGGYHYRLYGIHNVFHNGVSETSHTYTGSVYIN